MLEKALTNCFTSEHIFVLKELLKQFRSIQAQILEVENELAFADERKFAAWAGVASGNNESAGKKKDQNAGMEIHT